MTEDDFPRTYCVTGACGSVGAALVRALLARSDDPHRRVIGLDHDENGVFRLEEEWSGDPRASFFVADVRDRDTLRARFRGVHTVFHTAALKHVYQCEKAPFEAVQTNILGTGHVLEAARAAGVGRLVATSTDKAVNPSSVMGTSKLMAERLVTAASAHAGPEGGGPIFVSTRFGNVLGSNGSVLEVFRRQIFAGGDLTLTDERMTRFVMRPSEAIRLLVETADLARGGEVFITKMAAVRVVDLARAAARRWAPRAGRRAKDVRIRLVGARPGEKFHEELVSEEEGRRVLELDRYYVVLPAFRPVYRGIDYRYPGARPGALEHGYSSARVDHLGDEGIDALLEELAQEGVLCA